MASKEIILRDGSRYIFTVQSAEVVTDPNIWSETHVRSTGGGGYVHPTYGGHVSSPQVYSTVKERLKYFVKTDQGNELELNDAVIARKGHSINLIYGGLVGSTRYLLATENSALSKYKLNSPRYNNKYFRILSSIKYSCFNGKRLAITIGCSFIALIIFRVFALFVIPAGLFIVGYIELKKRIKHVDNELISFINEL